MRHLESNIQRSCVRWFRLQWPEYAGILFAVPNGGGRHKLEAAILKAEGVFPGVSDLILLTGRHGYNSLCLEIKTDTGRQSDAQKEWQKQAENAGSKYVVCRSVNEFISIVNDYLTCQTER
jgi:hypothetical protein